VLIVADRACADLCCGVSWSYGISYGSIWPRFSFSARLTGKKIMGTHEDLSCQIRSLKADVQFDERVA